MRGITFQRDGAHVQINSSFIDRKATAIALFTCAALLLPTASHAAKKDLSDIRAAITKRHNESVKRLQEWIALPAIAAEDRGFPAGAEHMAKLAREAGFQQATVINTDGKPGVFATSTPEQQRQSGSTSCTTSNNTTPLSGPLPRSKRASSTSRASAK